MLLCHTFAALLHTLQYLQLWLLYLLLLRHCALSLFLVASKSHINDTITSHLCVTPMVHPTAVPMYLILLCYRPFPFVSSFYSQHCCMSRFKILLLYFRLLHYWTFSFCGIAFFPCSLICPHLLLLYHTCALLLSHISAKLLQYHTLWWNTADFPRCSRLKVACN